MEQCCSSYEFPSMRRSFHTELHHATHWCYRELHYATHETEGPMFQTYINRSNGSGNLMTPTIDRVLSRHRQGAR